MSLFPVTAFEQRSVELSTSQPLLTIVVDTEEEFDWSAPFSRDQRSVSNAKEQRVAHEIYDAHGVRPGYVLDQAILESSEAVEFFLALEAQGKADLGVHLHPWLTPPYDEEVNAYNSFHGNLDPALEQAKIDTITQLFIDKIGRQPLFFKAGRYGLGQNSLQYLKNAGYQIDCSVVPKGTFRHTLGPDFRAMPHQPFWIDDAKTFLELPLSRNIVGGLSPIINHYCLAASAFFDNPLFARLRVPGVLAKLGLLERITLSPEGNAIEDLKKLLRVSVERGDRVFNMAYHSSSCLPGGAPYVSDSGDLKQFLAVIKELLRYFTQDLGGRMVGVHELYALAKKQQTLT